MRVQPNSIRWNVTRGVNARRPVVITLAGITLQMAESEARHLADELHDAAETR
ncbi:hypothetical protein [Rhodococcus pyridinivorans]|uniref:hypothetical protein n=1 Tax=Rhodococcus pyridinivorans TaxID=103816 RepID=UPI0022848DBA|nr:hypothetical protein [Rhodococcus pyridinivorans]WAL46797.1 hypothetical protein OQN32_01405 [Rhodococcus pyridinivorans]